MIILLLILFTTGCISEQETPPPQAIPGPSIIDLEDIAASSTGIQLTDAIGREVTIPRNVSHILCSGPGCMRYLAYLQETDRAVGADQAERDTRTMLPLPYLIAHPSIRTLPATGKESGAENPAVILGLYPRPDLIILMNDEIPVNPDELQRQTGIPVLVLHEGDLSFQRSTMNYSLRVMGLVLGKTQRAEEVLRFFDKVTDNLQSRTANIPQFREKTAYIGGYSTPEPAGLSATTTIFIPFRLVSVINVAETYASLNGLENEIFIPKEAISRLVPDSIFFDMTTWSRKDSGIADLERNDLLQDLPAVRTGEVYGLLPTALYGQEHESDLINAYVIGKALYPEKFTDVDPRVMADYIFTFLYGQPLYEEINRNYGGMVLARIPMFT